MQYRICSILYGKLPHLKAQLETERFDTVEAANNMIEAIFDRYFLDDERVKLVQQPNVMGQSIRPVGDDATDAPVFFVTLAAESHPEDYPFTWVLSSVESHINSPLGYRLGIRLSNLENGLQNISKIHDILMDFNYRLDEYKYFPDATEDDLGEVQLRVFDGNFFDTLVIKEQYCY